jgi:hypothetical protein
LTFNTASRDVRERWNAPEKAAFLAAVGDSKLQFVAVGESAGCGGLDILDA